MEQAENNNAAPLASEPTHDDMADLVEAVEDRLAVIKAKLAQGEQIDESDVEPLGEDVAQMFVQVSVVASWE